MSNLSFSIAINLLTENFKKGAATVKSSFEQMKSQMLSVAAVFGVGGFAFTSFISKILSASKETAKANMILKNVSDGTADFASNLNYSNGIAKKYGLYVNDVTSSLAKFIPSANTANISISNQRKIFESVVRASKSFGLSGEQTQEVLGGIDKSMRKGTLSTRDLRGALGTNIPVAMQAFAMATGKSIPQLNKLMSTGKLLTKDVFPKFADALTKLTPNINTDTAETALKRLKNVINGIANNPNFLNAYKTGIKDVASLAEWAGNNIKNIVTQVGAVIAAYVIAKARTMVLNLKAQAGILEAQALKSNAVLIEATSNRVSAEIALENAKKDAIILNDGTILDGKKAIQAAELNLEKAKVTEENALEDTRVSAAKIADQQKLTNEKAASTRYITTVKQRVAAEVELENANVQMSNAGNESEQIAASTRVSNAKRALKRAEVREAVAGETQMLAATEASAVKGASAWSTAFNTIKVGAAKAVTALSALWSTYGPMLIITAITSVIFKLVEMAAESNRINGIWKEYKNGASAAVHTPEIVQLKEIQDLYNKANGNLKLQEQYRNKINSLLGTHLTGEKAINAAINERIKLLEATAKVDYYTQQKIQAQDTLTKIIGSYGGNGAYTKAVVSASNENYKYSKGKGSLLKENYSGPNGFSGKTYADIANDKAEVAANMRIMKNASINISANMAYASKQTKYTPSQTPVDPKTKKTDLQKAEESYSSSLKSLNERYKIGDLTQSQYNNELDKLNKETLVNVAGLKQKGAKESSFYKKLESSVASPIGTDELSKSYERLRNESDSTAEKMRTLKAKMLTMPADSKEYKSSFSEYSKLNNEENALNKKSAYVGALYQNALDQVKAEETANNIKKYNEAEDKYWNGVNDAGVALSNGAISQTEYNDKIKELIKSEIEEIGILPNLNKAQSDRLKTLQKDNLLAPSVESVISKSPSNTFNKKKDTTFDYGKTDTEKSSEKVDLNEKDIEYYKQQIADLKGVTTDYFNTLNNKLTKAESNAPGLEKAMKLDKLRDDIKGFRKELGLLDGKYEIGKSIISGFENIRSAWSNLSSSFKKNPFEGMLSTIDAITSSVDSIKEVIDTISEISAVVKKLTAAKESEKAVESVVTGAQVTEAATSAAAQVAALGTVAAADEVASAAAVKLMAAESAAAYAYIPFAGVGLASAQVAALLGVISGATVAGAFATGGIVGGGSTSGDNVLARVNSGEMILNGVQQGNLFKAINSGSLGGGKSINTTVTHVIKGSELKLIINNELRLKGKKLIGQ